MEFGTSTPVANGRGWGKKKSGREVSGRHGSQNSMSVFEENRSHGGSSRIVRKRALIGEF